MGSRSGAWQSVVTNPILEQRRLEWMCSGAQWCTNVECISARRCGWRNPAATAQDGTHGAGRRPSRFGLMKRRRR
jgi:hypothetical protein